MNKTLGYKNPEQLRRLVRALGPFSEIPYNLYTWYGMFFLMSTALFLLQSAHFLPIKPVRRFVVKMFGSCLLVGGNRLEITTDSNFDPTIHGIFCLNHVNLLDGHLSTLVIPQPFTGLQLAKHFKIPIYGWSMKQTGGIPVHPRSEGRTKEIIKAVKQRIQNGLSILTFPEAHRTKTGKIGPFHRGVFFMARDAGIPIVPVASRGMNKIKTKNALKMLPARVEVYLGRQIQTKNLSDDEILQLAETVRKIIIAWTEENRTPTDEDYGRWA